MLKKPRTFDAILLVLLFLQTNYRKTYSTVTRAKIHHLLKMVHKIDVCLQTISYHLGHVYKLELAKGYPRSARRPDGTFYNIASNRSITPKGLLYFRKLGVRIARFLYDWAFKGIKPPRVKSPEPLNKHHTIVNRLPRGSAGAFTTISQALAGALKTIA